MKLTSALKIGLFCYYFAGLASCVFKPDLEAIESQLMPFEAPTITSISPAQLFTGGGTQVEITGENFETGTSVKIAGSDCLIEKIIGNTKILCLAPSSAEGSFTAVVTGPDGRADSIGIAYDKLAYTNLTLVIGKLYSIAANDDGYFRAADSKGAAQMTYDSNYLYTSEYDGHKIKKIDLNTLNSLTLVGTGINEGTYMSETNPLLFGLSNPQCLYKDGDLIYFCITGGEGIATYNLTTSEIKLVAGVADDDTSLGASFNNIARIFVSENRLIIVDSYSIKIKDLSVPSSPVVTVAGDDGINVMADGLGTAGTFEYLISAALIGDDLYVLDQSTYNFALRKINLAAGANYAVTTVAGDYNAFPGYGVESTDGVGALATFNSPRGITVVDDKLIIADEFDYDSKFKIRMFDTATGAVTTSFTITTASQSVLGTLSDKARIRWYGVREIYYIENYGLLIGNEYGLQRLQ